jgi:hypothetical protein
MQRWLLSLLLLLLPLTAAADESIVPVEIWSGHKTFTATSPVITIDVPPASIPTGVVAIVGWTGWIYQTDPLPMYSGMDWWHDGGTPHRLQASLWTFPTTQGTWNSAHVARDTYPHMLPAPGHRMTWGDRLYMALHCFPKPSKSNCRVEAFATFYLRVVTP